MRTCPGWSAGGQAACGAEAQAGRPGQPTARSPQARQRARPRLDVPTAPQMCKLCKCVAPEAWGDSR